MKASLEITEIEPAEEFRICPKCGYTLGFHSSFLREEEGYRIILICPECGARYDLGWRMAGFQNELSAKDVPGMDLSIIG